MIRSSLIACLAVPTLAGCLESVEPERVFGWEGDTEEAGFLFESAFAWYEDQQILIAGVAVEGDLAESDQDDPPVRSWRIHSSSCAAGGPVIGQEGWYPNIAVDITGDGQSQTWFNVLIDIDGMYHAKLYTSPDDDTVLACIDLTETPL